ncbi:hypothetical protein, partial [Actinomyces bowdenii]|uniref:hypothetical protein n=1 Tax=Actinomyces bowdenii TaxID=131109 RepID=UPI00163AE828
AEGFPGGWGYIIAFTATDPAIRTYVTNNTIYNGNNIDKHSTATQNGLNLEDVDVSTISNPWSAGTNDDATLLLERPLGRGWLIIKGAPR